MWRKGAGLLKMGAFRGYRVIVQDQHDRDLPLTKLPAGTAVDLATPDVDAWQRPEFAAKPFRRRSRGRPGGAAGQLAACHSGRAGRTSAGRARRVCG